MIQKTENRLQQAEIAEELPYLYHELSRYHAELKKYEMARVYARKCISEGYKVKNLYWVVNAMLLIAKVYIQQRNRNDAKSQVIEALKLSEKMDKKLLTDFLEKVRFFNNNYFVFFLFLFYKEGMKETLKCYLMLTRLSSLNL